jgi:hypothetical protein
VINNNISSLIIYQYIHSPIFLNGFVLNELSTGATYSICIITVVVVCRCVCVMHLCTQTYGLDRIPRFVRLKDFINHNPTAPLRLVLLFFFCQAVAYCHSEFAPESMNLIIIISLVRLNPLGTAATTGLLNQPQMIDDGDCRAICGMKIGRGNRSTRRKPAPAPLCPPHFLHDQTRARTRTAAVGSQRLTA